MIRRRVTKADAEAIARAYAEAHGWPWIEPVKIFRAFRSWRVLSNAAMRGGNVTVYVNAFTAEVRRGALAPR